MSNYLATYEKITNQVIEISLSEGLPLWRKPWKATQGFEGSMFPMSIATGRPYRGINVFMLAFEQMINGYASRHWGTYDQLAKLSGAEKQGKRWVHPEGKDFGVRKGQKGTHIVFWKRLRIEEWDDSKGKNVVKYIPMLREFVVFNTDQCHQETLPEKFQPVAPEDEPMSTFDPIAEAQAIVDGYEIPTFHGGNRAYYSPSLDEIHLPTQESFGIPAEYYSTRFHEMGHSTGHESRLGREGIVENHFFGDELYSKEELVAEMTAAMLAGIAGIENVTLNNSASYLKHWVAKLKEEPKMLIQAAAQAQKACDLILGVTFEDEADAEAQTEEVVA